MVAQPENFKKGQKCIEPIEDWSIFMEECTPAVTSPLNSLIAYLSLKIKMPIMWYFGQTEGSLWLAQSLWSPLRVKIGGECQVTIGKKKEKHKATLIARGKQISNIKILYLR